MIASRITPQLEIRPAGRLHYRLLRTHSRPSGLVTRRLFSFLGLVVLVVMPVIAASTAGKASAQTIIVDPWCEVAVPPMPTTAAGWGGCLQARAYLPVVMVQP